MLPQKHTTACLNVLSLSLNLICSFALICGLVNIGHADDQAGDNSFLPTWKLLSAQEKQHFVSGYIQGWSDARKVTEIALEFIKTNPDKAVESLESIRKLYDVTLLKPDTLATRIDAFYEDPANRSASLSMAVTAAQASRK